MARKKFICTGLLKHGEKKDGSDQKTYRAGDPIEMDAKAAEALVLSGALMTHADWKAKEDAPAAAAEAAERAAQLEAELDANRARIEELEGQVAELSAKVDGK